MNAPRTRADLDGAFALLERQADAYATAADETVRAMRPTGDPVALVPHRRGNRGRLRTATVILAAAAVTGGIAVGVDQLAGTSGPSTHRAPVAAPQSEAGTSTAPTQPPPSTTRHLPRALPFSVPASTGLQIVGVHTMGPSALGVELASRTDWLELSINGPGTGKLLVFPGMHRVDVNGHRGYVSDGKTAIEFGVRGPDDPAPGSGDPVVVWRYAPNSWATLSRTGGSDSESDLLAVARSVDFGGTTPMRSAISLEQAPSGMQLLLWGANYHLPVGQHPPYDLSATPWGTSLQYGPGGTANEVAITAVAAGAETNVPLLDASTGQAVAVAGRSGFWSAAKHQLTLDLGDGAHLDIREVVTFQGTPMTMTLAQLSAIAADVTLAPHPDQPDTWFDANTALP